MRKASSNKSEGKKGGQPFNLILLGDPGAGKATQGAKLVKKYPFLREFDFGVWLRAVKEPKLKRRLDKTTFRGHLAPGDVAKMMFRKIIFTTPKSKGVFFNGNPRAVGEAKLMLKWFREVGRSKPLVLYLHVSEKEMLQRLSKRRRVDDTADVLKNRLRSYQRSVHPTLAFFKSRCRVVEIPGKGTREQVFRRLVTEIEKFRAESE